VIENTLLLNAAAK